MLSNPRILKWLHGNEERLNKLEEDELFDSLFPEFKTNKNKYGFIGEILFEEYLQFMKIDYEKQVKVKTFRLDFETENAFWEIKTRRYNMSGTAGEKVLFPPFKYRDIFNESKALNIVLLAFQEVDSAELFSEEESVLKFRRFYEGMNVHFIKFTSLIQDMLSEPKPFLKWAGGKTKSLKEITWHFPHKCQRYLEPFLGGGSVLLEALKFNYVEYIANDANTVLIEAWKAVRDDCENVISELKLLEKDNSKEAFIKHRTEFNKGPTPALFIFLNKTCFRGLFRVNKQGEFNVPFGNYKSLNFDYENIRLVSKAIKNVEFVSMNYIDFLSKYKHAQSFIYLDPPYYGTFDSYTIYKFDSKELTQKCVELSKETQGVLMSNSMMFLELMEDVEFEDYWEIELKDSINSKNPGKTKVEVLIEF